MSGLKIALLTCGIIFALGLIGAIIGYIYRYKHPYQINEVQNSSWVGRWIKSNFNLFMWVIIAMIGLSMIGFFVGFAYA